MPITTPIGTAVYPHLNEPDTKFEDDGVYTTQLRLTAEEADTIESSYNINFTMDLVLKDIELFQQDYFYEHNQLLIKNDYLLNNLYYHLNKKNDFWVL